MVELAIANTDLTVDDCELCRNKLSYSIDTLASLRGELGQQVSLSWVMGTDAFAGFDRWHRWHDFLMLGHLVVIKRPGEKLPETGAIAELTMQYQADCADVLHRQAAGSIVFASLTPYPVSATDIRATLSERQASAKLKDNMAAAVLDYIQTHQLYGYHA